MAFVSTDGNVIESEICRNSYTIKNKYHYMIDTIKFSKYLKNISEIQTVMSNMKIIRDNPQYKIGFLNNLRITIDDNKLTVEGSLCKFYKQNNIEALTRYEIREALRNLRYSLGINIFDADVRRVDFGDCFICKYSIPEYLNVLIQTPGFDEYHVHKTSKRFGKENYSLIFYDKLAECSSKKIVVGDKFLGKNILRYEIQWSKRIKQQLKLRRFKVTHFFSDSYLHTMEELWKKNFFAISKESISSLPMKINSPIEFKNALTVCGIELTLGLFSIHDLVKLRLRKLKYHRQSNFSRTLRKLYEKYPSSKTVRLMSEIEAQLQRKSLFPQQDKNLIAISN